MKKLLFLSVLLPSISCAEFHYKDCVEITGGFFYQKDSILVSWIWDKRITNNVIEYRVGNVLFGTWIESYNLSKVDSKVCEEAEKNRK